MRRRRSAPSDDLSGEVSRILSSEGFAKSAALSQLLGFLSEQNAKPSGGPTSEYAIAQDLLGRGADFDPKADPIVRVQARRLREALDSYYEENPGPLRLRLPPRSYDLELIRANTGPRWPRWVRRIGPPVGALIATVMIGAAGYATFFRQVNDAYPVIKILSVQNLTGDDSLGLFEQGLQRQLASDLQKFGRFRVLIASQSSPAIQEDYTLRSSLLELDQELDLAVRLETGDDDELVYGDRFRGPVLGQDYYETIRAISRTISGQIAGQGGPLVRREDASTSEVVVQEASVIPRMGVGREVFRCVVLKDRFFDNYEPEEFVRAYRCFERVLSDIGNDPVALTSWGTLIAHAVPAFKLMQTAKLPPDILWEEEAVTETARSIVERFPNSADAFLLLGSVQNAQGRLREAEISLRQSVELNPGNSTGHAVLSYLYLSQERFTASIGSAEEAIKLSADPQSFMFLPILVASIALGDERKAIDAGRSYTQKRTGDVATVVELIVARLENDRSATDRLSSLVREMSDPAMHFAVFLKGEQTKEALQQVLPEVDFDAI
ncbi:tetratricopeptide repeat protein [Pseudooceanicola sp. MF1-13]|uniref:tetratricopeptide repeat protein n=1 Tax=Pseudooceanicola sp. MF1-13 TaxID=3379095 RepID=UPI0038919B40